ncbi:hypothetical protein HMPREF3039_01331 [Akkermansia sp. KLE1798]|nr:hypothetical protein HMPREF3039_01331 [Akkermansia sp. KLE1798]KZA04831.1 hypothetical protein HMPREF1326_01408 [Akkermansia sp. KLE1605]
MSIIACGFCFLESAEQREFTSGTAEKSACRSGMENHRRNGMRRGRQQPSTNFF